MYKYYNANPEHKTVGDCVVRAIATTLEQDWEAVYAGVVLEGFLRKDMPSSNDVWGAYLRLKGFARHPTNEDISVAEFAEQNPNGRFVLALSGHVVSLIDGDWLDIWDSGGQTVLYYWKMEGMG